MIAREGLITLTAQLSGELCAEAEKPCKMFQEGMERTTPSYDYTSWRPRIKAREDDRARGCAGVDDMFAHLNEHT